MPIPYLGGKTKYAKPILNVILPGNEHRQYWEPFVGSGAFLIHVPTTMQRFANDKNPYLIAMHEAIRDGWQPPINISEEEYKDIRDYPTKYPKQLVGFISFGCSFGATMGAGYARNTKGTNYAAQSARAVCDTVAPFQRVSFMSMDYAALVIPNGALVYCDPPYSGFFDYGDYKLNSTGDFWRWCNRLIARDCKVFVSGYKENKHYGWEVVWSQEVTVAIANNSKSKTLKNSKKARVECLFAPTQKHVNEMLNGLMCECWKTAEDLEREARLVAA